MEIDTVEQILLSSFPYSIVWLLFSHRLKINVQNVYEVSLEQHPKRGTILPWQPAASRNICKQNK